MAHPSDHVLKQMLKEAQRRVKIHCIYSHYKNPHLKYRVLALALQEATDKVCVIYQAECDNSLVFVRDLESWLEQVEVDGKKVRRFTEIEETSIAPSTNRK